MVTTKKLIGVYHNWTEVLRITGGGLTQIPGTTMHENDHYEVIRLGDCSKYQVWRKS